MKKGLGYIVLSKQLRSSTNGVLNKLNASCFAFFVKFYADEVYAPVVGQVLVTVEVGESGGDKLFFLGECHRFLRAAEAGTGLGAHFDKHEIALALGNDVDFTFAAAEISFANAVTFLLEEVPG